MFRLPLQILFAFLLILLWQGCAQMTPLTGGARDKTAPKLISASPENLQINFHSALVTLKFDEYVQLKELKNQLVISPKLTSDPEITSDGKKIKIHIDTNALKPNTTYRFFLGDAIVDMNEGNPLHNFEYIFSTGTFIDSLSIKGRVRDAFSNALLDNVLIGVYTGTLTNDSLPYNEVPDYVTRSTTSGEFEIAHLPLKTVKVYAVTDANKNLVYDPEAEKIAFLDSALVLTKDTAIQFRVFKEDNAKVFIKKTVSPYYGHARIFLNKKTKVQVSTLSPYRMEDLYISPEGGMRDSIYVYFKNIEDSLKLLVRFSDNGQTDTVNLTLAKKNLKKKKFGFIGTNTSGNVLALYAPLRLSFINWMDTSKTNWKTMKLIAKKDSVLDTLEVHGHWLNVCQAQIDTKIPEGRNYTLILDTSTFCDIYSTWNDSTRFCFRPQSKTEFGKVILNLVMNKKQHYLIQLINEKDQVIKEQSVSFSLSSSNAKSLVFNDVPPGIYLTKIIFDDNNNSKWDGGNLFMKRQAETVIINSKQLKVIPDWEIEEEIAVRE